MSSRPNPVSISRGATTSVRGIFAMLGGCLLLTLSDTVAKILMETYPVGQVLFLRGVFMLVPIALLTWRSGGRPALRVHSIRWQVLRGFFAVISEFMFLSGLALMPIADTMAVTYAGPLIITALAVPLLSERVGWRRWAAITVGFLGVLIIIRPTSEAVRLAALFPLAAAFAGALRDIATRHMRARETSLGTLTVTTLMMLLATLATLPFGWQPFRVEDLGLFALAGLLFGGALYLLIVTYRLAEAGLVAPFRYSSMIWAVLLGFLIWGDLPDRWVLAGTFLLVASGLYVFHRESRWGSRNRPPSTAS